MRVVENDGGFETLVHPAYPPDDQKTDATIAIQSTIIGGYLDAIQRPGTSALWIGADHHLNREEVAELIGHLARWLATGSLQ